MTRTGQRCVLVLFSVVCVGVLRSIFLSVSLPGLCDAAGARATRATRVTRVTRVMTGWERGGERDEGEGEGEVEGSKRKRRRRAGLGPERRTDGGGLAAATHNGWGPAD